MLFKKINFFILAISFVIVLCAGEIFSKFYLGLGEPPLSIQHSKIEYMFKPKQNVKRFGNRIEINEYGMRSKSISKEKSKDEFRILVFGDSVVNGGNLTDQENLATSILQNKLTQLTNKNITVANVSAGSWGPGNWLAYTEEFGFFYADLVILVVSSHDYIDNPTFKPLDETTHPTKTPVSALYEGLNRYLPRYFPALTNNNKEEAKRYRFIDQVDIGDIRKGMDDLKMFLLSAKQSKADVYVFQYLEKSEIIDDIYYPGYFQIKNLCANLSIPALSFESYFQDILSKNINPYRDYIHPNDIGQTAMANAFADFIIQNNAKIKL